MIQIKNLCKKYNGLTVLQDLNLQVKEGEILVILGRSGVGKSVLLRHILGIEKPDSGTVEVNGKTISELSQTDLYLVVQNMGMLFQGGALFDSMNVEKNTGFYLAHHKNPLTGHRYSKQEIYDKVMEALKMVGLEAAAEKMPSELSGGMKKRAALARLIVYRPKILLYDEPTTGLDPMIAQQINELIVKIQDELKGTSIIVTHDIHSALFVADRMALQDQGKIAYIADPDTFMKIDDPTINFLKNILTHHPHARKEGQNV
jgi:phospholipid/cholesterol/gamma-HCH transport system ATP-binding protein